VTSGFGLPLEGKLKRWSVEYGISRAIGEGGVSTS